MIQKNSLKFHKDFCLFMKLHKYVVNLLVFVVQKGLAALWVLFVQQTVINDDLRAENVRYVLLLEHYKVIIYTIYDKYIEYIRLTKKNNNKE